MTLIWYRDTGLLEQMLQSTYSSMGCIHRIYQRNRQNSKQKIKVWITTLEMKLNEAQAAPEKQMIGLQQETLKKMQKYKVNRNNIQWIIYNKQRIITENGRNFQTKNR